MQPTVNATTRPLSINVDRSAGVMRVSWLDGHQSEYSLRWLRAHCPCATCREERREQLANQDELRLTTAPPPSTEIVGAEFVGQYAIRFSWGDGHTAGIFPFLALRASCPCSDCNPDGPPPLVID